MIMAEIEVVSNKIMKTGPATDLEASGRDPEERIEGEVTRDHWLGEKGAKFGGKGAA